MLALYFDNAVFTLEHIVYARLIDGVIALIGGSVVFTMIYGTGFHLPNLRKLGLYLTQSLPLVFSGVSVIAYQKIDQIMVKQILGLEPLAIYSANLQTVATLAIIPTIFAQILARKVYSDENKNNYQLRVTYMKKVTGIGLLLTLFTFLLGELLVQTLFGDAYRMSYAAFIFLAITPLLTAIGASSTHILVADGAQGLVWVKSIVALVINVVLNLILIPRLGILGGAISTASALLFGNLLSNYLISSYRYVFALQLQSFLYSHNNRHTWYRPES